MRRLMAMIFALAVCAYAIMVTVLFLLFAVAAVMLAIVLPFVALGKLRW